MANPPSTDAVLVPPQLFPSTLFDLNHAIIWQYPIIAAEALILFEALRTVPAEARMWIRAEGRGRLNAAELIFLTIKYAAIIGMTLDCVIQLTQMLPSSKACHDASWASEFFVFFAVTFVSAALGWRALIIFQRSRTAHVILVMGFAGQIAVSFATFWKSDKYDLLMYDPSAHYCVQSSGELKPWYELTSFWYLLYSLLFDVCIVSFTTRRLLRSSRGPSGLARISRMLFQNGIEYAIAVCCLNFAELLVVLTARTKTPSLLHLTIVIQIICAMNLLIEEQDAVHGHGTSMTSMARPPPQYSHGPSVLPTVSVMTNNSDFHHEVKRTYQRSPPNFSTFSRGSRSGGALPLYPVGRAPDDISISTEVIEKCPLTPAADTLGGCSSTTSFNGDPFPHLRREAAQAAAKPSTDLGRGLSIRDIRNRIGSEEIQQDDAPRHGKRVSGAPSIPPLRSASPMSGPTSADAWPLDMGRMYSTPGDGDITSATYALRSMSPDEKQPFSVSPRQDSIPDATSPHRVEHEIMAASASHHRRRFSLDDSEAEEQQSSRGHGYGYGVELDPAPRRHRRPRTSDSGRSATSSNGPFMTVSQRSMVFAAMRNATAHNSL